MSGLIVGLVLRTPITDAFTSEAKFIATVYADHAWEDGTHAHPAVETVARITGLSVRTVQRYVHGVLAEIQMLIPEGKGPRGTIQYRFPLETKEDGSVRLKLRGGVTVTPRQPDGGDTESGDRESGDSIVSPKQTTRPLIHEEEEKPATKFSFSAELQAELTDLGVFVSVWKGIDLKLTMGGWTEADTVALIDWMRSTRKDKAKAAQGFVTRMRENTKAPQEYYAFSQRRSLRKWYPGKETEPVVTDEPALEPDEDPAEQPGEGCQVEQYLADAWESVLAQLCNEMPRATFNTYLSNTMAVRMEADVLYVGAPDVDAAEWLESRITSTAQRLLVGVLNQEVKVKFVAVETEVE